MLVKGATGNMPYHAHCLCFIMLGLVHVNFYSHILQGYFPGTGPIDQSHRYGRPQAACREPAGSYDKTTRTAICFEHKTQYLLIHAQNTGIVVFWHISNIPPMISQKLVVTPHILYSSNICEILLYNRQLFVITHELIYGVRAAIR